MAKAVGFGGVFLKARDPKALAKWYEENLGIPSSPGGLMFGEPGDGSVPGITTFACFPLDTKYFGDGPQTAMLNFRVDDLDGVLAKVAAGGAKVDEKREEYDFGRFAWFWDPEGNRVELWEPAAETDEPSEAELN
jgi:predicted enzyme related to lactoylglutathione lyase